MKKPKRIVSKILKILKHIAKNHGRRNENVKEDNEYIMVRELIEALGKIAYVVSWNVRSVCFASVEGPRIRTRVHYKKEPGSPEMMKKLVEKSKLDN